MKWGANPACCQVKDCPQKYTALCQYFNRGNPGKIIENEVAVIDIVCTDSGLLTNVFAYLVPEEIMSLRRVCRKWKEAVKKTIVPLTDFRVYGLNRYNAMRVMTRVMPNLQQITIGYLDTGHKYSDGEDPYEPTAAMFVHYTTHDIGIISNFSKLSILTIDHSAPLNGRYPFLGSLSHSFPLLQKLSINRSPLLKWDLEKLTGFSMLKELNFYSNLCLTGNIRSLRLLKDTLEKVEIRWCCGVDGNFMDLADFPHLKELNLESTAVTGDIRDIDENDFLALEQLILPRRVYGGIGYKFQRISDGPDVVRAVYLLEKQRPTLSTSETWYATLSEDSPDSYESVDEDDIEYDIPFYIEFVEAGPRVGYRWTTYPDEHRSACEVNWLDPEPDRESSNYEEYIEKLQKINSQVGLYRGIHQPPTEEEYLRLHNL
jgi:hypothetical protein